MLCLFVLVMLEMLSVVFLRMLPIEATAALRAENGNVAALVAESGVTECLAWLRFQLSPPDGSASREPLYPSVYPSESQRTTQMGGGWSFCWSLTADDKTYPNGSDPIRAYTLVSVASRDGVPQRQARVQIVQDSFSRFAKFVNVWPSSMVYPLRSNTAPAGGPVHVNDKLRLWIAEGASFWTSPGSPPFSHGVTASGVFDAGQPGQDGFAYYQGNTSGSDPARLPYDPNLGPIKERYARMVAGGQQNMKAGAARLDMPANTFNLRDAAWGFGSLNPLPTADGVYVNSTGAGAVSGGITIVGTVEEMQLGFGGSQPAGSSTVDYGTNSWVKVEQPVAGRNSIDANQCVTVVTVKESSVTLPAGATLNGSPLSASMLILPGNTLVRKADGTFALYSGGLNGAIYVTENIQDLWGVNKGRRTIAVESNKATGKYRKIVVGGKESDSDGSFSVQAGEKGLLQAGMVDGDGDGVLDVPANADNVLGLVAYDVEVSSKLKPSGSWSAAHPATNPLYMIAVVLAGIPDVGGGYKVAGYDSGGSGCAYRIGGQVQCEAGAWGTTSGNGFTLGNTFFDPAAASSPPPYFPTLPTFSIKSYEDIPIVGGRL